MVYHWSFTEPPYGEKDVQMTIQEGATLGDLLAEMAERYGPAFKKNIFDPDKGALNSMVMFTINGTLWHALDGINTVLQQGDNIVLVPFAMGG